MGGNKKRNEKGCCVSYEVRYSKGALKQFNKLSSELQERIQTKIDELADNPRPDGVTKLRNGENRYRFELENIMSYIRF